LIELYKKNHPEEFQAVTNATPKGYSPPKVNREVVDKLKELYRKNHPEEFPPPNPTRKGYIHPDKNALA
jgi:hypothetical protein